MIKSIKRSSDSATYIALLSRNELHICELFYSMKSEEYKIIKIKDIHLSMKFEQNMTQIIELFSKDNS